MGPLLIANIVMSLVGVAVGGAMTGWSVTESKKSTEEQGKLQQRKQMDEDQQFRVNNLIEWAKSFEL